MRSISIASALGAATVLAAAPAHADTSDQYSPGYGSGFNARYLTHMHAAGLTNINGDRATIKQGWSICDAYDDESIGELPSGGAFTAAFTGLTLNGTRAVDARTAIRLAVTDICPEHADLRH